MAERHKRQTPMERSGELRQHKSSHVYARAARGGRDLRRVCAHEGPRAAEGGVEQAAPSRARRPARPFSNEHRVSQAGVSLGRSNKWHEHGRDLCLGVGCESVLLTDTSSIRPLATSSQMFLFCFRVPFLRDPPYNLHCCVASCGGRFLLLESAMGLMSPCRVKHSACEGSLGCVCVCGAGRLLAHRPGHCSFRCLSVVAQSPPFPPSPRRCFASRRRCLAAFGSSAFVWVSLQEELQEYCESGNKETAEKSTAKYGRNTVDKLWRSAPRIEANNLFASIFNKFPPYLNRTTPRAEEPPK